MKLCSGHLRLLALFSARNNVKPLTAVCIYQRQRLTALTTQAPYRLKCSRPSFLSGKIVGTNSAASVHHCCGCYRCQRIAGCRYYSKHIKRGKRRSFYRREDIEDMEDRDLWADETFDTDPYEPSESEVAASHEETEPSLTPPWRILFFGSDAFSYYHLKAIHENLYTFKGDGDSALVKTLEVVSPRDRQNVITNYCYRHRLRHHQWPMKDVTGRFDVGVVSSFGQLIPEHIINMFPHGILNVHASYLPKYRGGAPIMHAILNGDRETGVSIMDIRPKKFDVGPIVLQKKCVIPMNCEHSMLHNMLATEGTILLMKVLENLLTMKAAAKQQNAAEATFAPRLESDVCYANFEEDTAEEIVRQYHAIHEKHFFKTLYSGIPVKLVNLVKPDQLLEQRIQDDIDEDLRHKEVRPGYPYYHKNTETLCIKCKDGWIGFKELIHKKQSTARNFYHGYLKKEKYAGVIFESRPNLLERYMRSKQNANS